MEKHGIIGENLDPEERAELYPFWPCPYVCGPSEPYPPNTCPLNPWECSRCIEGWKVYDAVDPQGDHVGNTQGDEYYGE